jgi:tetratricopeptide (TPR) repeat protein
VPASAASPPARPAEDRAGFESRLRELEAKVQAEANAFKLLQVELDADKRTIRRAWGDLSRDWHPDGLKSRGLEDFSERVQRVFAALSEAHMVLGDDAKRDELKQLIALGGSQKVKANANAAQLAREALRAEVIAREGDKLLKAGRIPRALEKFREAIALHPGDPDTETAIVWCEYLSGAPERALAKAALAKVDKTIEEYPNLARAHFVRGMLLVAIDSPRLAIAAFEEAHRLDPRDVEAQRQARVARVKLDESKPDKKKDKGLFAGIFGSGKR